MPLSDILQISAQGMTAQRERLEASAANLANANTTRTAEGGPYRRRDVVFEVDYQRSEHETFEYPFDTAGTRTIAPGVRAETLIGNGTGEKHFQPGHPDADADGYVTMPDVDALEETVNIVSATRAFEANATVFNSAKEMVRTSLKLSEV